MRAARLALDARAALDSAQRDLSEGGPDVGRLLGALDTADAHLDRADGLLGRPSVRALGAVPVLGRSVAVEVETVRAARSAVHAVTTALEGTRSLSDEGDGLDPAALRTLAQEVRAASEIARTDLRALAALPLRGTPTAVARAARDARLRLDAVVEGVSRAEQAAEVAGGLLGGDRPRTLLLGLANNAELQGVGGYVSSWALAQTGPDGVRVSPFRDVIAVADPPDRARRVPAPAELAQDYGPFLADTTLWRTWSMSPDVPEAAQTWARAAGPLLGTQPDAVLLLDVPALAALAEATGGVVLDGRRLSGEQLQRALLVDAYDRAGLDAEQQVARRTRLQSAASSAVARLLSSPAPAAALAPELARLAAGRHVTVWSAVPAEQRALRRLGVSGELGVGCADLVAVTANNLNANKLDYYVRREVRIDVEVGERAARVVQTVRLTNEAPPDLVPYVAGAVEPGVAVERVELSAGPAADVRRLTVDGTTAVGTVRRSADRVRVATAVRLRPGRTVELVLRYDLPREGRRYELELVPQPLAVDAPHTVRLSAAEHLVLRDEHGQPLPGGLTRTAPLATSDRVVVDVGAPADGSGVLDRLRGWWSTPLRG